MSGRKKRAPGEFIPVQFATCIEDGLNIHVYDMKKKLSAGAAEPNTSLEDESLETKPSATKAGGSIPTDEDAAAAADDGNGSPFFPRVECTNGAMEALRLSHSAFIATISSSLGELSKYSANEQDVMACLEEMGLSNLAQRAMAASLASSDNDGNTKQPPKKKRKKAKDPFANFKGTEEELIAEQERLLSESAQRMQMMNQKARES